MMSTEVQTENWCDDFGNSVRLILGVTYFHGKQILFCTLENPELSCLCIIKGNSVSWVAKPHACPNKYHGIGPVLALHQPVPLVPYTV